LPRGLWDVFLSLDVAGISKDIRIGNQRCPQIPGKPQTHVISSGGENMAVALYYTHPYDNLTVDVGENKHHVADKVKIDGAAWTGPGELEVTGSWALASLPVDSLYVRLTREDGRSADFPATARGGRSFSVTVRVSELAAGTWTADLRLTNDAAKSQPLGALPAQGGLGATRWRRLGMPWYAKPTSKGTQFKLRVDRIKLAKAVAARLKG
ncbi:glycosyltransferase family 2 protein, partial [Streptomyces flavidovirens]